MKLTGITRLLARLGPIEALHGSSKAVRVFGVLGAAKPALVAAVREIVPGPLVVVTAHPQTAHDLYEGMANWSDRSVALFPAVESLPYERVHLDRALLAQRETAMREVAAGDADILLTPIRALLQPVRVARHEPVDPLTIAVGERIQPEELARGWVARGYAAVSMVEEPGTFARRGGVMDIFPVGADAPVRLELFGNDIESLRTFDPATQRSIGSVSSVTVHPLASLDDDARLAALEALMDVDDSSLSAEARTAWQDDLARLEAGASLDELAIFAPYLVPDPCSLIDNLPENTTVLVDTAQETWEVMGELWAQADEVQRGLVESGNIPGGLRPALLHPADVERSIRRCRSIEWLTGSATLEEDVDWSGLLVPAHLYGGRVRDFVRDVVRRPSERMVITTYQRERVVELLEEEGRAPRQVNELLGAPEVGVTVLPVSLSEGWSLVGRNLRGGADGAGTAVVNAEHADSIRGADMAGPDTALPHPEGTRHPAVSTRGGGAPVWTLTVLSDHELFGRPRIRPVLRRRRASRESFFARFQPGDSVVHQEHGIGRFDSITRMDIGGSEREYAVVQYAGTDRVYVPTDQLERLTRYIGVGETPPQLNKLGGGEWQRARQRAKAAADSIAKELIDVYSKRMARAAFAFSPDTPWQHELETSFPYPETPDQLQAVEEVKVDMEAPRPMDRLVCADVGYGKTEVAVRAAFKAIMDGKQVAVLVPTTILAQQHLETFCERFAAFPVKIEALSRFRSRAEQREILKRVESGELDVVIGTHRLLQKDVIFKNLGLLVVDEEQRFGVRHKEQLKKMREAIDVLTLTATPIPRTLHMGLVGIREISVIETPPEGRLAIRTYLQPFEDRLLRESVLRELDREGQVYVVHNRVATIQAMAERVTRLVPEARVAVAHGQMDEGQLEKVMLGFAHGESDVLICSTIIENGLDIPNVNTIIVNNAHRLGLTQLYQLRGRVGRSASQAYAYLLYPQDVRLSRDAMRRMEAVFEAQELGAGMNIAMTDLEIRGVGNLLGAEQSGNAQAIGFDLYTRMIGEAVERLRGIQIEEVTPVTLDLPITMFLPAEYVGNESERLTLYRRLASVETFAELEAIGEEMRDRFGAPPTVVQNLLRSVRLKLTARAAKVSSISLGQDYLALRGEPSAIYDRVSLYRRFGSEARISTNVLRIPRFKVAGDWIEEIEGILDDMIRLREAIKGESLVVSR